MTKNQWFKFMMLLLLDWHLALEPGNKTLKPTSKIQWTEFLLTRIEKWELGLLEQSFNE